MDYNLKQKILELVRNDEDFRQELMESIGQNKADLSEKDARTTEMSRRNFLKRAAGGAGLLGASAMIPGTNALNFETDDSFSFGNLTSDQSNLEISTDGDLDMYGNEIVNAGKLDVSNASFDQMNSPDEILVYGAGNALVETVNPDDTNTPIQDAIDLIGRESRGAVVFPTGKEILSPGEIVGTKEKAFLAKGRYGAVDLVCTENTDFFVQSENFQRDLARTWWDGIRFRGANYKDGATSSGRTSGSCFAFTRDDGRNSGAGKAGRFNFGRVNFTNWHGPDPVIDSNRASSGSYFTSSWHYVNFGANDGILVDVGNGFVGMHIGLVRTNWNQSAVSNPGPELRVDAGGEVRIDSWVSNEHTGKGFEFSSGLLEVSIGNHHFETNVTIKESSGNDVPVVDCYNNTKLHIENPAVRGRGGTGKATSYLKAGFEGSYASCGYLTNGGNFEFKVAPINITQQPKKKMKFPYGEDEIAINYFDGSLDDGRYGWVLDENDKVVDPINKTKSATVSAGGSTKVNFTDIPAAASWESGRVPNPEDFDTKVMNPENISADYSFDKSVEYSNIDENYQLIIIETKNSISNDIHLEVEFQPYR